MDETANKEAPPEGRPAAKEAPDAAERKVRRAPGRRYIYKRWCKGCGICVAFCPVHVFALGDDGRAEVINPEACTNCQICDRLCPDFAITLTDWEDKYDRMFQPTSLGPDKAEGHRGAVS